MCTPRSATRPPARGWAGTAAGAPHRRQRPALGAGGGEPHPPSRAAAPAPAAPQLGLGAGLHPRAGPDVAAGPAARVLGCRVLHQVPIPLGATPGGRRIPALSAGAGPADRAWINALNISCTALSEREAAAALVLDQADVAPGARAAAIEAGLDFISLGVEAFDFALTREVWFRRLFQDLLSNLGSGPAAGRRRTGRLRPQPGSDRLGRDSGKGASGRRSTANIQACLLCCRDRDRDRDRWRYRYRYRLGPGSRLSSQTKLGRSFIRKPPINKRSPRPCPSPERRAR
jgi:hypothetical protein